MQVSEGRRLNGEARLHSGPGRLLGYHISHAEPTPQTVTFYDSLSCSGKVLLVVHVAPGQSPAFVHFSLGGRREEGLPFQTGLAVKSEACEVAVWAFGYTG